MLMSDLQSKLNQKLTKAHKDIQDVDKSIQNKAYNCSLYSKISGLNEVYL